MTKTNSNATVPLLDLKVQYATIEGEIKAAIERVFASQYFIMGPEVAAFEKEIAAYCGVNHAIGCASGSDALMLALMALNIGFGDEVIIPTYTFFATGGAVARLGARPIFVDARVDDFNIDCSQIRDKITPRTKAIMPVHLYGQCADMDELNEIGREFNLPIIEDAAQAIGAMFNGKAAGAMSLLGCFSFFPTKNLGGAGDGGMLITDDAELAEKLKMLRVHGSRVKYHYELMGVNSRLDELQAAVLRVKLKYLDGWSEARTRNAERYDKMFAAAGVEGFIGLPIRLPNRRHIFNQYVIRAQERNELMAYLKEHSIGTEIYYPEPLHTQRCFVDLGLGGAECPVADKAGAETLALPIYPELSEEQQQTVVDRIADFYQKGRN